MLNVIMLIGLYISELILINVIKMGHEMLSALLYMAPPHFLPRREGASGRQIADRKKSLQSPQPSRGSAAQ